MHEPLAFGYLPVRLSVTSTACEIVTLETMPQEVEAVRRCGRVHNGWLWPPRRHDNSAVPVPRFAVPMTHAVHPTSAIPRDEEEAFAELIIAAVGFLYGVVLTPDGWGHLRRVCVEPCSIPDYMLDASAVERVLGRVTEFWHRHPGERRALFGILWWHAASLAHDQEFEIFTWQYTVFDACWALHRRLVPKLGKVPHWQRIETLCREYDLDMPRAWGSGHDNLIARSRNDLFHQAKWGEEPVGLGGDPSRGERRAPPPWEHRAAASAPASGGG